MESGDRQAWLERVRQGERSAIGLLLESYRPYVAVLVRALQPERLQAKLSASDLAQDALLEAIRCFDQFRGSTVEELTGWLRQIVMRTAAHTVRAFLGTRKRDAGRERSIDAWAELVARSGSTPSAHAIRREESVRVAEALGRLPEDMQTVLLGRHLHLQSYAELAQELGRSEGAVRVLYTRALRRLRDHL